MRYLLILTLFINQTFAFIIGGRDAGQGEFPWFVTVYNQKKMISCGGSIVHSQYVLTAAHCVEDEDDPAHIIVIPETARVQGKTGYYEGKSFGLSKIILHPKYVLEPLKKVSEYGLEDLHRFWTGNPVKEGGFKDSKYDIAVLKLNKAIDFSINKTLSPITLFSSEDYYAKDSEVIAIGRGVSNRESMKADKTELQVVKLPLLPPYDHEFWTYQNQKKYFDELIRGYLTNIHSAKDMITYSGRSLNKNQIAKSTCYGDSGSSIMVKNNGDYKLLGVHSGTFSGAFTKKDVNACKALARAASIPFHYDWIRSIVPGL